MEQIILSFAKVIIFVGAIAWLIYGLLVIWLALRGWRRVTWNDRTKWPFFFRQWQKMGKKGHKVIATRDTVSEAVRAEVQYGDGPSKEWK